MPSLRQEPLDAIGVIQRGAKGKAPAEPGNGLGKKFGGIGVRVPFTGEQILGKHLPAGARRNGNICRT